ncbi:hypothetical protein DSL72_002093 [Monilinia vaccinii-corymbosi]|uniref:EKC/KEOPS complex subunit GON7 n=1 Tax=Monilinia vaccinii-corymbosi TaxID=61207 RepID=A0A8A3PBM4_9HELO|nr:hypothetical protein DSL72_002093 [Monilinia vaccinii-corymbosi]
MAIQNTDTLTTTTTTTTTTETSYQTLSATYSSPNNEKFEHIRKLPTPTTSDNVSDRTAYLGALRKATVEMQEKINKELTARMAEDKLRETGSKVHGGVIDEAKEEDNYGEEMVDEED